MKNMRRMAWAAGVLAGSALWAAEPQVRTDGCSYDSKYFTIEVQKPYLLERYRNAAERCAGRYKLLFGEEPPKIHICVNENPDLLHTHTHESPDGRGKVHITDTFTSTDGNSAISGILKAASEGTLPFIYMDKMGPRTEHGERMLFAFGHELGHRYAIDGGFSQGSGSWWDEAVATYISGEEMIADFDIRLAHHLGKDHIPFKDLLEMGHPVNAGLKPGEAPDAQKAAHAEHAWTGLDLEGIMNDPINRAAMEEFDRGNGAGVAMMTRLEQTEDLSFLETNAENPYEGIPESRGVGAFYAESQSLLGYFLARDGVAPIRQAVEGIRQGGDARKIFTEYAQRYPGGVEQLEKDWLKWASDRKPGEAETWKEKLAGEALRPAYERNAAKSKVLMYSSTGRDQIGNEGGAQDRLGFRLKGNRVARVTPGSAAAAAGVIAGDEIVSLNGQEVHGAFQMSKVLDALPPRPEAEIPIAVRRAGNVKTLTLPLRGAPARPGSKDLLAKVQELIERQGIPAMFSVQAAEQFVQQARQQGLSDEQIVKALEMQGELKEERSDGPHGK